MARQIAGWRQLLRDSFVEEPVLVSLYLRWVSWLLALVIVVSRTAPPENLLHAPWVLGLTLAQLLGMTVYPKRLRPKLSSAVAESMPWLWPVPDMLIALGAIYFTGGWNSPFYHFGITTVLAPSLRFGLWGALISSVAFSSAYIWVVKSTSAGFKPAYGSSLEAEPSLISSPLNPVLIALYAAFLGETLKKLHQEMERSKKLAAQNERNRMAQDIHDGVSQTLFMLSMSLETGQVLAEKEGATKTASHLGNLTPVARKALMELRNAMYHRGTLGELSLEEGLGQLARDYQSATGIQIEVRKTGQAPPQELRETLFKMCQEALANACQHSGSEEVKVLLAEESLEVTDRGRGYCPEEVSRGRGLDGLQRRAKEAGIVYSSSTSEEGTSVRFTWGEGSALRPAESS